MLKGFSVAALVVALGASTACALDLNIQSFDLELTNGLLQVGDGAAGSTNLGLVLEAQQSTDDIRHTTAYQGFNGAITQAAGAVGTGTISGVCQDGQLVGAQVQDLTTGFQTQCVNSDLDETVFKAGGTGSVLGIETALGIGTQLIFTPYGATANVQGIGDVVYDAAAGGLCGSIVITGGGSVGAGQTSVPW
jgi:hypothetical protein